MFNFQVSIKVGIFAVIRSKKAMAKKDYRYLERVNSPADLKELAVEELPVYCAELRDYIVECCAVNPGHLSSSLGAVEIAVALHYVFDFPNDRVVWDVGHQAYVHKILTGRGDKFDNLRKFNGNPGNLPLMRLSLFYGGFLHV